MNHKKLMDFMSKEIREYNRIAFNGRLNDINEAGIRLRAIRDVLSVLEPGTGVIITWHKTDPLQSGAIPISYIKACAIEYMDIWGKKHIYKCDLKGNAS